MTEPHGYVDMQPDDMAAATVSRIGVQPDLKPEEIEILESVGVVVGDRIASGQYGGQLQSLIYEGKYTSDTDQHLSGEKVAIKWLRFSANELDMVTQECNALEELKHDNIVEVRLIYWMSHYSVAMVMEMATYGCMPKWVEKIENKTEGCQPMSLDNYKRFFVGLADALRYLHGTGRAHWDLHWGNVLVFDYHQGGVKGKLTDFGSIKSLDTHGKDEVHQGQEWDLDALVQLVQEVGKRVVTLENGQEDIERVVEEVKKVSREESK